MELSEKRKGKLLEMSFQLLTYRQEEILSTEEKNDITVNYVNIVGNVN